MNKYIATTKPKKVVCKTHEDWLSNRTGLGSSEIATVVGLNAYETKYQLWLRKTGQTPPKQESFLMKAGHYLEDAVAKFYEDESGRKVIARSAAEDIYIHPNFDWARVSPDRLFWLDERRSGDNKGILECKTTQFEIDPDQLPPYWFTQVQYQLGVMGRDHASLAWLSRGRTFDYRDIDFAPDYFVWLMEEGEKFMIENVQGGVEPPLTTAEDVVTKYAVHSPGTFIEADAEIAAVIQRLKEVKAEAKELDLVKEDLESRVKLAIGEAESLNYQGSVLATFKAPKTGKTFDKKALEKENPEIYNKYMIESQGARRLLIK